MEAFIEVVVSQARRGLVAEAGQGREGAMCCLSCCVSAGRHRLCAAHSLYSVLPLFKDGYLSGKHGFGVVGKRLVTVTNVLHCRDFLYYSEFILGGFGQIARHSHVFPF